jgi:F-type H+-transporting ATPase subunit epsilon
MAELEVDLVDADGRVWSGPAYRVSLPAADGDMGILPGHTPVLALLRPGMVRILTSNGGETVRFAVTGGFLSVDADQVTIAVDDAKPAADEA